MTQNEQSMITAKIMTQHLNSFPWSSISKTDILSLPQITEESYISLQSWQIVQRSWLHGTGFWLEKSTKERRDKGSLGDISWIVIILADKFERRVWSLVIKREPPSIKSMFNLENCFRTDKDYTRLTKHLEENVYSSRFPD